MNDRHIIDPALALVLAGAITILFFFLIGLIQPT